MNNKSQFYLDDDSYKILLGILSKYPNNFYAYGSRVKGTHNTFSDLDICVDGDIDLWLIKDDFEESNLPIKIDIVLKSKLNPDFLELIKDDLVKIKIK